ncbi:SMP-30/gluconolactonase/LRE family protein [uncultured Bacteroides sp.]|uniref:SMP-30/gluconolactonase/LRE family protein n=1 Tax=uncultured Bacteroides sp. TaxID=162156 RepID=UPI002AA69660|nr:SMP-30/gluconolactonase/LRE family protein [uncultured Bacteroides sp.]
MYGYKRLANYKVELCFARSSSVLEAIPGKSFYVADEYNRLLARMDVKSDGTLTHLTHFASQGEFGSSVDKNGNIYVGDGHIYVFNNAGERIDFIKVPERPSSLVVAGRCGETLFITARSSLYRYTINH